MDRVSGYTGFMPSKRSPYGRGSRSKSCRECGALAADGAQISARALCRECAIAQMMTSADQQVAREGRYYDQWVESMLDHARRLAGTR